MYRIPVNHGRIIMKKTNLLALCILAVSFGFFACSDDSSTGSGTVNVPVVHNAAKKSSTDYTVRKPCNKDEDIEKAVVAIETDTTKTVPFLMNEDGSATVTMVFGVCKINTIFYEIKNDTLYISGKYIDETDCSVSKESLCSETVFKCICLQELELNIPSEFVGAKYFYYSAKKTYVIDYIKK